jgi:hypothetical protein
MVVLLDSVGVRSLRFGLKKTAGPFQAGGSICAVPEAYCSAHLTVRRLCHHQRPFEML